jgi:translation initiation factor eIF-2B subunit delta
VHLLNLAYDLLPADFVTVVVTEMGAVPATSVAVILREAQRDSALL